MKVGKITTIDDVLQSLDKIILIALIKI